MNTTISSSLSNNEIEPTDKEPLFSSTYQKLEKRESLHRVFVNRTLDLNKIKFYGFELDYTLAAYKSPDYEKLSFDLVIEHLLKLGYPKQIKSFKYDLKFSVRGLWYDLLYGNLLKVDTYGNILVCVRGFKVLKEDEILAYYPNEFLMYDAARVHVLDSLNCLPEIHVLASLIDYFTTSPSFEQHETGVRSGDVFVSFKAIYQDVRVAINFVQAEEGDLVRISLENLDKFLTPDDGSLTTLIDRMHENGSKVFLLTNSGYDYTNKVMNFLLKRAKQDWRLYFDYIVVDAKKPLFFAEGTSLKEIDIQTGKAKLGTHSGPLKLHQVYSGGSSDVFSKLIGSYGKDVLFVGAYIFGDIIKSKKERAWRTFLVIPELAHEIAIWHEKHQIFTEIERLHSVLSEYLVDLDSSSKEEEPETDDIHFRLQESINKMDLLYGKLGGLFRSRLRQTHFASQVTRYADIYASSYLNLLHYPFFYLFKATPMLMSHESSVNPSDPVTDNNYSLENRLWRSDSIKETKPEIAEKKPESIKHSNEIVKDNLMVRPGIPPKLTHYEDFDEEE